MSLLLDTHTLIWSLTGDPRIPVKIQQVIDENVVYVSAASIWEIRIKQCLGKLQEVPENFYNIIKGLPVEFLSITLDHAYAAGGLPLHHRDPFDRILIAQAYLEDLILVTNDKQIQQYSISTLLF